MKIKTVFLFILAAALVSSCDFFNSAAIDSLVAETDRDNPLDGDFWEQITTFPGEKRMSAVLYAMDGKIYYGLGHHEDNNAPLTDMWTFTPGTEVWTELPVSGDHVDREDYSCTTYIYENTVYIVEGWNHDTVWEFDGQEFSEAEWGDFSSLSGGSGLKACYTDSCVLFGIESDSSNGYVYYSFFPETGTLNSTLLIEDPPGFRNPAFFTIDGKIYTGGGEYPVNASDVWDDDTETAICRTFREFDPDTGDWSEIPVLPDEAALVTEGFAINGTGYVLDDEGRLYAWSPGDTAWTQKASFPERYGLDYGNSFVVLDGSAYMIRQWAGFLTGAGQVFRYTP